MKTIIKFFGLAIVAIVLACPAFAQGDKFQQAIAKALADGARTAVKDENGRVESMEIEYFSPKQTVWFEYEKDTVSSVTLGNGTKMTILRDKKGKLDGFVFPDGRKAIFLWKKIGGLDFKLPAGLKFISPDGKETLYPLEQNFKQEGVSFRADDVTACRNAIAASAAAVVAAGVACSDGGIDCISAAASAAVAIAVAVDTCRSKGGSDELLALQRMLNNKKGQTLNF